MNLNQFKWTREPASYSVTSDKVEPTKTETKP